MLEIGTDVYIKPDIDTGEVSMCYPDIGQHDVNCDGLATNRRYPETALAVLPYKERVREGGFLVIRKAKKTIGGYRILDIKHFIMLSDGTTSLKFRQIIRGRR